MRWVIGILFAIVVGLAALNWYGNQSQLSGRVLSIKDNPQPGESWFEMRPWGEAQPSYWVRVGPKTQIRDYTNVPRELAVGQSVSVWGKRTEVSSTDYSADRVLVEEIDSAWQRLFLAITLGILTGGSLWLYRLRRRRLRARSEAIPPTTETGTP